MATKNIVFRRAIWLLVAVLCALVALQGEQLLAQRAKDHTVRIPGEQKPISSLRDLNQAFIQIAKDVTPSVVTVSTERTLKVHGMDPFAMDPFAQFFGYNNPHGRNQAPEQQYKQMGLGSGVIISADGYILTNNHVVAQADSISVRTVDGRTMRAKVVGTDPKTDVAVIRVNARDLTPIRRGNSDDLQVGEIVLAIGSPLTPSLAHTVTQGIVSAKGRSNVGLADYEDFIQTDAAINPGNSGGALVNLDGELIGINTAIASQSGGSQGIGFAVPVNMAFDVMNALIDKGKVVRGWLGVSIQEVNDELARAMNLRNTSGVVIGSVTARGPADRAGLEPGDVVTAMNGQDITSVPQFRNTIARTAPGTSVTLTVLRDKDERDFKVRLGELPEEENQPNQEDEFSQDDQGGEQGDQGDQGGGRQDRSTLSRLGFSVATLTPQLARQYDVNAQTEGVVIVNLDPNSVAASQGLREGDVIRQVNRRAVPNASAFNSAVRALRRGDSVLLLVQRSDAEHGDQGFFVAFEVQ